MAKKETNAITPTRAEDYPEWYQQVVRASDLAEPSPVRGCMVIKPWGYAVWENIQRVMDREFKRTGHKNAYFPLFIPKSYLEKEAAHVEGFAKECAVVTHHRLEAGPNGTLVPAGELEEPLIVRPTSETIIGETFSNWVQSYRDLPLLINQWANVVRWELRTRVFLRTTEFLWQEGHTVHATSDEAIAEARQMLDVYADVVENHLAIPVIRGEKSAAERFPGAVSTWTIEAMMQDGKALQSGTSHFLGQNFAKASKIRFLDETGVQQFAWTTSWGTSTRMIGGLVMTHSDDDGLILPPRVAPAHVVILPITAKAEKPEEVINYCKALRDQLQATRYHDRNIEVELDTRDLRGGEKLWGWVKKGIPIRLEIGPRDMAQDAVFMARRDKATNEKQSLPRTQFIENLPALLDEIQNGLLKRARDFRSARTREIDSKEELYRYFNEEPNAGFALTHWSGDPAVEAQLKTDLSVTLRCIPLEASGPGTCPFTNQPSKQRVVWAKSY